MHVATGRGLLASHLEDLARDFSLFDLILGLTALLAGFGRAAAEVGMQRSNFQALMRDHQITTPKSAEQ